MNVLVSITTIALLLPGFATGARGDYFADFVRYRCEPDLHRIVLTYETARGKAAVARLAANQAEYARNGIYLASNHRADDDIYHVRDESLDGQNIRTTIRIHPPAGHGVNGALPTVNVRVFIDGHMKVETMLGHSPSSKGEYSGRLTVNTEDRTILQAWQAPEAALPSVSLCYGIEPSQVLACSESGPKLTVDTERSCLQIGKITLVKVGGRMQFITPCTAFTVGSRDPVMETLHAVNSPFVELTGMDGVVADGPGVVPIDAGKPLDGGAFTRFAFFTERKTSVGVLWGIAGASGGSSQTLVVCDTETGQHVAIEMVDICTPIWLDKSSRPPPYAETTTTPYLGAHALSLGFAPRVHKAYTFDPCRLAYERDPLVEVALCAQRFGQVQLTAGDTEVLFPMIVP